MKRQLVKLVSLVLILTVVFSLGVVSAVAESAKPVLRYIVPGNDIPDLERVQAAVNAKLAADGLSFEVKIERIPFDVWDQKTSLMIATQEEFDIIHVMQGTLDYDVLASRGALMPIKQEWLDAYGTHLKEMISPAIWEAATWNGSIYTVPDLWTPLASRGGLGIRKDLFDKYNIEPPKNAHEMVTQGKLLHDAIANDTGEKYYFIISLDMPYSTTYFFEEDPTYPFFVGPTAMGGTQLVKINNDGTVESWLESDAFKVGCDFMYDMYQAGLILPDALTIPRDTYITQYVTLGKGVFTSGASYWDRLADRVPGAEVSVIDFKEGQEVTAYVNQYFYNSNAISATSKHPEECVQFLDWIQIQENGQLLCYGEKGIDWFPSEKGEPYYIPAKTEGGYFFDMWEFLPYQFRMYSESTPEYVAKPQPVDHIETAINAGFTFDNTSVLNEWTAVDASFAQYIWPIELGIKKYDENIDEALRVLRGMGLDKIIAEYDRQFQEWLAAKDAN